MFSANENILLRQHKKRVVEYVESTIPESALDAGVNVMAMQVTCTTPGCVPIETAIIVIFPKLNNNSKELLPGLPESAIGGSYKTKILKPLAEVTKDDVLDALPPSFQGGTKSITKLCYQIRDALFGHITQLFDDDNSTAAASAPLTTTQGTTTTTNSNKYVADGLSVATDVLTENGSSVQLSARHLVAQYLQECLQEYINNHCIPPEIGQPYPDLPTVSNTKMTTPHESNTTKLELLTHTTTTTTGDKEQQQLHNFPTTGNITIPRPIEDSGNDTTTSTNTGYTTGTTNTKGIQTKSATTTTTRMLPNQVVSLVNSSVQKRQQAVAVRGIQQYNNTSANSILAQLASQPQLSNHARGIRRAGCPCCDPDNTTTIVDQFLSQT